MLRYLLVFVTTLLFVSADISLVDLINGANNNQLIMAKSYKNQAALQEKNSLYSQYLPRVAIGYNYTDITNPDVFYPKTSDGFFAEASFVLFDGFKRESRINMQDANEKFSYHDYLDTKERILLDIISKYYSLLMLDSKLQALLNQQNELEEVLKKQETLYNVGLIQKDSLEAIRSKFLQNSYNLENIRLEMDIYKSDLSLLSGLNIKDISSKSKIKEVLDVEAKETNYLLKQKYNVSSIEYLKGLYTYFPTITVYNKYTNYRYGIRNIPQLPFNIDLKDPTYQNIFGINVSFTIFDSFATHFSREGARLNALSANLEYAYNKDKNNRQIEIARNSIKVSKSKIVWASSSLESAKISHDYARKKFDSQLIDYTEYLSSITALFNAETFYKESLYEYEIQKAKLIFVSGEKLEEFVCD